MNGPARPTHRRWRAPSVAAEHPALSGTLAVALVTALLLAFLPRPLSPDVSGQLWIADRMRHGARLYRDIAEINPPLWFWLAMPVQAVAVWLGVSGTDVLIVAVGGAALASLLATARLLPPAIRAPVLLYGVAVLLIVPLRDTGQREQLALFGALPYAALIAARREGRRVPVALALLVGAGAASGFALKHYFVFVPLLIEAWLAYTRRRGWRPLRPETLILAAAALAYVAAIVAASPDYLRTTLPELQLAYGATAAPALRYLIRPAQPIWLLILAAIGAGRAASRQPLPPLAIALLLAAVGFAAAWAIQHKGWPYHSIPTTGTLALALAVQLAEARARPRAIAVAALVAPALLAVLPTQEVKTGAADIWPALADLHAGDTVALIARDGRTTWPATVDSGLRFVGRRTSFWMFAAVDEGRPGAEGDRIAGFGRQVVREAAIDLRCLPPRRILFMPRGEAGETSATDNPLAYFRRDPDFARLLTHYRPIDRPGDVAAFDLVSRPDPLPPALCPRAP